ncbi:DUF6126 family protein [Streptomyces sp. NA04227]|uniref:DUF6126 family protein n=1 Tax=Streptomyces sp. NA04227 TaxID=2742136 RepID=UPI0034CE85D5
MKGETPGEALTGSPASLPATAGADPATATALPARPTAKSSQEDGFPKALGVRLFVYLAGGHLLGAFLWLLFELGGSG